MVNLLRVLVTGGAGFIGSYLVSELLHKGYSVVVLDNLSSGKLETLNRVAGARDFEFIHEDVRNRLAVNEALSGVNAVVHLAALIDVQKSVSDPLQTHDVNVNGTLNVLQEATRKKITRFVFLSSAAVYGECSTLPIKEDVELKPISPYAASKVSGEAYCQSFSRCYDLNTIILRPFNIYGPGNESNPYSGVIARFIKGAFRNEVLTIHGDGKQTRDFVSVHDVVNAIVLSLESQKSKGDVFNICTGRPTSINQLVEILSEITGKDLKVKYGPPKKGDIRFSCGDPEKAVQMLKFRPKTSLEEGLQELARAIMHKKKKS